jgi:hypothetical protein
MIPEARPSEVLWERTQPRRSTATCLGSRS